MILRNISGLLQVKLYRQHLWYSATLNNNNKKIVNVDVILNYFLWQVTDAVNKVFKMHHSFKNNLFLKNLMIILPLIVQKYFDNVQQ